MGGATKWMPSRIRRDEMASQMATRMKAVMTRRQTTSVAGCTPASTENGRPMTANQNRSRWRGTIIAARESAR